MIHYSPEHVKLDDHSFLVQALCTKQVISGYPSIRIYRQGSDKIVTRGFPDHESYHGDRTTTALQAFVDSLVESVGKNAAAARVPNTRKMSLGEGCQVC
jgi:hypothetical protein